MERLAVDDVDQDQADDPSHTQSEYGTQRGDQSTLDAEHDPDFPTRHADMMEHPELAPASKRLGAETHAYAEKADHYCRSFERIRDGKSPIEDGKRSGPHFTVARDFNAVAGTQAI